MRVQVLHVPDCPNIAVLDARLAETLAGRRDVVIEHHVIRDHVDASAHGMTGSPTVLVDGLDPFAIAGQEPTLSCRLYLDEQGANSRAPTVAQLHAALATGASQRRSGNRHVPTQALSCVADTAAW